MFIRDMARILFNHKYGLPMSGRIVNMANMETLTDEQLIKTYLSGERIALEILIRRNLKMVFNFLYRLVKSRELAEDLSQETFVKSWKNIAKFDSEKKFKNWILTIAKNTALDYLKKKQREVYLEDEDGLDILENFADEEDLPDEMMQRQDLALELEDLLRGLPTKSQVVLHLYFQEQMTFQEIADVLEEPLNTVKSRQRRALLDLRKKLESGKGGIC